MSLALALLGKQTNVMFEHLLGCLKMFLGVSWELSIYIGSLSEILSAGSGGINNEWSLAPSLYFLATN